MNQTVGFIGLGGMGRWMALNLIKAGYQVLVHDLDASAMKITVDQGAAAVGSPAELADRAGATILCLPHAGVVNSVLFDSNGLASRPRPGMIVVDCGTTNYLSTLEMADRLSTLEILFADAPVSGMEARAKEGTLTIMCGGSPALFDRITPMLKTMGNKILHMGDVGAGQLTKLVNQLLFNISCAAIAEVLPMSTKLGLAPEKVVEVVTSSTGRSFAAEFFRPADSGGRLRSGISPVPRLQGYGRRRRHFGPQRDSPPPDPRGRDHLPDGSGRRVGRRR